MDSNLLKQADDKIATLEKKTAELKALEGTDIGKLKVAKDAADNNILELQAQLKTAKDNDVTRGSTGNGVKIGASVEFCGKSYRMSPTQSKDELMPYKIKWAEYVIGSAIKARPDLLAEAPHLKAFDFGTAGTDTTATALTSIELSREIMRQVKNESLMLNLVNVIVNNASQQMQIPYSKWFPIISRGTYGTQPNPTLTNPKNQFAKKTITQLSTRALWPLDNGIIKFSTGLNIVETIWTETKEFLRLFTDNVILNGYGSEAGLVAGINAAQVYYAGGSSASTKDTFEEITLKDIINTIKKIPARKSQGLSKAMLWDYEAWYGLQASLVDADFMRYIVNAPASNDIGMNLADYTGTRMFGIPCYVSSELNRAWSASPASTNGANTPAMIVGDFKSAWTEVMSSEMNTFVDPGASFTDGDGLVHNGRQEDFTLFGIDEWNGGATIFDDSLAMLKTSVS